MEHTMEQRPMERMTRVTAASHEACFWKRVLKHI